MFGGKGKKAKIKKGMAETVKKKKKKKKKEGNRRNRKKQTNPTDPWLGSHCSGNFCISFKGDNY